MYQLLLGFCLLMSSALLASVPPAIDQKPLVTAQEIIQWVRPESPDSVQTVEDLLKKLPETYRRYFVLQYESRSNHSSNETHPRMIFFGPDAKLLLGASGLPSDPHYQTVEMIEYEPQNASYSFYSIHFQQNEPPKVEVNPADCLRCHGGDPKPNWEPYSLWPGAFGSLHDRILPETKEFHSFESFLKSYKEDPRYRHLPGPFHVTAEDAFGKRSHYLSNAGVGPGSTLSILLGFLNRDRIAKRLVSSEDHLRYRPALTAALLGCTQPIESFLPSDLRSNHLESYDKVLNETEALMEKDFNRKIHALTEFLEVNEEFILPHSDRFGFRTTEIERIAKLRYLLQKRKNPLGFDRWALSISKTSLDFNDGVSGLENLIGHYLMLAYEETDPLRKSIALNQVNFPITSLSEKSHDHHSGHPDPLAYSLETFSLKEAPSAACDLLIKEAKALSLSK